MELWIRSQDREGLIKCDCAMILTDSEDGENIRGYKIVGYFENARYGTLGFYISKTRALEVLDEIETEIQNYVGTKNEIVYQMPEE